MKCWGRLLRVQNQSRTAKTVEMFGWLILIEGPMFLLFPNLVASALHLPSLVERKEADFHARSFSDP